MAEKNLIGQNILGYTVSEKINSGAFGTVYKVVKNNESGEFYRALKHIVIPTEKQYNAVLNSMGGDYSKADDYFAEMLKNIVSEIRILNELSERDSQHIVRYYENDIQITDSPRRYDIFILMEYLNPLENFLLENVLTVREAINLGLDILNGLQACHNCGIIHRDIKEENIFVSKTGKYKIGDFGVSKILKNSSKAESFKGTPNFLAPEIYQGKGGYTKSVDLYSLGIVLYRLLNYGRNPFVPHFPAPFYPEDDVLAFEERMKGKIPDLPSLGGAAIGEVIIKSISDSTERFQTAEEFIAALKSAAENTPAEIFEQQINFPNASSQNSTTISESENENYNSTLKETAASIEINQTADDIIKTNSAINQEIFQTQSDVSNIEENTANTQNDTVKNTNPVENNRVVRSITPSTEQAPPTVLDKSIFNKIIFIAPLIIFLIGIIAYFVVIPNIYGKTVSFIDWLFTDSETILNTLRDPNKVLPQIHSIIGIGIFWWLWLAGFIVSLFFVGQRLNSTPEPNAANAILKKNAPYFMIQDISEILRQKNQGKNIMALNNFIYNVKRLEDKFSVESDFGYGNSGVIKKENEISEQLQILKDGAEKINKGDILKNISELNEVVANINSMLRTRTELKKVY